MNQSINQISRSTPMIIMMMMKINCFYGWPTKGVKPLYQVETTVTDSHHRKSLSRHEQDLNLSSGLAVGSCAVAITTTPRCHKHGWMISIWLQLDLQENKSDTWHCRTAVIPSLIWCSRISTSFLDMQVMFFFFFF